MTDIHHSPDLLSGLDQARASTNWSTGIVAVIALLLALGLPHLTSSNTGDASQFQSSDSSTVKLDGRGKWVGYM